MVPLQNANGDEAVRVTAASSPPRVAHHANTTRFRTSHALCAVQETIEGRKGSFLPKSNQTFFAGSTAGEAVVSGVAGAVCAGVATSGLASGDAAAFAAMLGVFVIFIFFRETRQRYAVTSYVVPGAMIYKAFFKIAAR